MTLSLHCTTYAELRDAETCHKLLPGQELTLGRGHDRDVLTAHPAVSRRHAKLLWSQGETTPRLLDEGGPNTTLLDDQPVSTAGAALKGHHTIRLGPDGPTYTLSLYHEDGTPLLGESTKLRLFTDPGQPMAGELGPTLPLDEVIHVLESEQRSGTLHVDLSDGEVALTFCLGQVMAASGWGADGLIVVKRCLQATLGSYRFETDFEPVEDPMWLTASNLLKQIETRSE